MKELRQKFTDKLTIAGRSTSTIRAYVGVMKDLTYYYRANPLTFSHEQIEKYLLHLNKEKKLAPATINLAIGAMKTFYKMFAPDTTVMQGFGKVRQHKHLPVVLSTNEVQRLIEAIGNLKQRAAVMLLYSAGLRVGECVSLQSKHIDSQRMKVHVVHAKGNKDRYTLLSEKTLVTLREYYRMYKPGEWLFRGLKGGHYSTKSIQTVIKRAALKAGINKQVTPHTLRHSFATHLLETGVSLPVIQKLLGHSSIKTTMIYLHVTEPLIEKIKSPFDQPATEVRHG